MLDGATKNPEELAYALARTGIRVLGGLLRDMAPDDVLTAVGRARTRTDFSIVTEAELRSFAVASMSVPTTQWHELAKRQGSLLSLELFVQAASFAVLHYILLHCLYGARCSRN